MGGSTEALEAPVLRPTKAQFSRPFCDYVREVFQKHPDWAMFKVVPPRGWAPRKARKYNLDALRIETPIRQHAFGKGGAYTCILEEHRSMTAADFKRHAESHQAPPKGPRDDDLQERAFWSSVTVNPPLYGADTPISLFDNKLEYGWNLKHLDCLFKDYSVPAITGVTTPMTYFGSWKSFSGWHKEDIDLNSINYLHFGEPKVWYCVSPKDAERFDEMTRSLFPDAYRRCPAFMRHKDVLISPKLLRHHGIPFMQAKQEPGEFIVLNAAAYHSVYNLGFNCAEAVNFAIPEWLPVGRDAVNCECECLPDGVQLDMGIFFPDLRQDSSSEEEESDAEEEESDSEEEEEESDSEEEEEESSEEEEEEEEETPQPAAKRARGRPRKAAAAAAAPEPATRGRGRPRKAAAAAAAKEAPKRARGRPRKAAAAEEEAPKRGRLQQRQQGGGGRGKRTRSESDSEGGRENTPANKRQRAAAAKGAGDTAAKPVRTPKVPLIPSSTKPADTPRGAAHAQWGPVAMDKPMALVTRDEASRALSFSLVHRLAKPATKPGSVWVGLLVEGPDGMYRPSGNSRQVQLGLHYPKLVSVRAEWVEPEARRKGAWKLTTTARRILM